MIRVSHLQLYYPSLSEPVLRDIQFTVKAGELMLIAGPTGSGKSTLLNCLNGVLHHESSAEISGDVQIDGQSVSSLSMAAICRIAGTVLQNPASQICTATPETEIAFGLENLAVPREEIQRRTDEALRLTDLTECRNQHAATLSGGQQQRLAIACALALKPKLLLLDEPLSQLDPRGIQEILAVIRELRRHGDLAVIVVEHRLEELLPMTDRLLLLDQGRVQGNFCHDEILQNLTELHRLGLQLPQLPDLFIRLSRPERPLSSESAPLISLFQPPVPPEPPVKESQIVTCRHLSFAYTRQGPQQLIDLSLSFYPGERVALMGANGAGKSTLLYLLAGLFSPTAGDLSWTSDPSPSRGLVLQSPDLMLFSETVREEIAFAPNHAGVSPADSREIVDRVLENMNLAELADAPPFALSRGQRLRTAVGSVLSLRPEILLLDEPTTGQDREQIDRLMGMLESAFRLLVFCTHDVDTAARHANRVICLQQGRILADGPPDDILFRPDILEQSAICQTPIQRYAQRLGVKALDVATLARAATAPVVGEEMS